MQLDNADVELPQDHFDAPFNGRMVSAVASDKFLDHRAQYGGRTLSMWNTHVASLPPEVKTITATPLLCPKYCQSVRVIFFGGLSDSGLRWI
jgi:hypothetical protein